MQTNYTEVQVKTLADNYTGKDNATELATLAEMTGKTEASVRSKLTNMGVYVKNPVKATAGGVTSTSKQEYTKAIQAMLGARGTQLASLEKATKGDLTVLFDLLKGLSDRQEAEAS